VDDLAIWTWGPNLHDYLNDYLGHPNSELDRYPGGTELDAVPGSATYGSIVPREFVPITWDLDTGETWTFEFPTGDVVFYDPNLTPLSASYGAFDSGLMTWTVVGPSVTGGPDGSPGNYPLEPWGAIYLPEPPALLGQLAALGLLGGLHRWRSRRC